MITDKGPNIERVVGAVRRFGAEATAIGGSYGMGFAKFGNGTLSDLDAQVYVGHGYDIPAARERTKTLKEAGYKDACTTERPIGGPVDCFYDNGVGTTVEWIDLKQLEGAVMTFMGGDYQREDFIAKVLQDIRKYDDPNGALQHLQDIIGTYPQGLKYLKCLGFLPGAMNSLYSTIMKPDIVKENPNWISTLFSGEARKNGIMESILQSIHALNEKYYSCAKWAPARIDRDFKIKPENAAQRIQEISGLNTTTQLPEKVAKTLDLFGDLRIIIENEVGKMNIQHDAIKYRSQHGKIVEMLRERL